jgi:predicted porin
VVFDDNGGTANANLGVNPDTGTGSGYKETLHASVFYHLSKRTEVYVAGDYMKLHDGYVVATTIWLMTCEALTATSHEPI